MNKFQNIWSIEKQWWDSDIDIIKNNTWKVSIYKKYYTAINPKIKDNPYFTLDEIQKYHQIQNNTKLFKNKIKLSKEITLLWNKIHTILIDILKLDEGNILYASDLETKIRVVITNPKYIEWIKWKDTFNEYLKNLEYQKTKEIKKLLEDNIDSDKMTYPINSWWFELSQLSTFNIKVISIKNWVIKLLITDIANKIKEIIKNSD